MTNLHMLDTNTVSYIVKGRSPAARARLFALKDDERAAISVVTEAEIRYGLAKRPQATALITLMEALLASIRVLPWDRDEAEAYGELRAKLEKVGLSLENMDMMIAAHALSTGATLVTNDKAFALVSDLRTPVNWATDL